MEKEMKSGFWDLLVYFGFGAKFFGLGMIVGAGAANTKYFYLYSLAIIFIGVIVGMIAERKRKLLKN
jgi:hypothetical protein